jgi:hypothetical protein
MASQQGSRTALVTWVVVLAITSVTAIIFAFYFSAASRKLDTELSDTRKKYSDVVSEPALAGPDVQALKDLRSNPDSGFTPQDRLLNVALGQRDRLAKALTGSAAAPAAAEAEVKTTLAANKAKLDQAKTNVTLPSVTDNLAGAVTSLTGAVVEKQGEITTLQNQLKAANANLANAEKRVAQVQDAAQKQIADVRAETQKQLEDAQNSRTSNVGAVAEATKAFDEKIKAAEDAATKANQMVAQRDQKLSQMSKEMDAIRNKLEGRRSDVANPTVTHADGRVVRNAGANVVYVDLGQGDQVTPGLTFEVYDKSTGIPGLNGADDQLPKGKASIEVTRVGPTTSECRVVSTTPGASPITEGDLISNIVYDRTTKFNFVVYGKFDLDQNGLATDADSAVVKRLITQWGGKVVTDINADTDFVVIGKEPVIPNYTKDELGDPINAKKYADAQAELDAYQQVVNKARDLHIPILNQNRFLYYVGYYDLAKR